MLVKFAAPLLSAAMIALPVWAQTGEGPADQTAQIDALFDALALPEMIGIMREEGIEYGAQIARDLLPGNPSAEWQATVEAIYDPVRMEEIVRADLHAALADAEIEPIIGFFEVDPGRTIIELEVSARRALLDEAVEEASKEAAAIAMMDETERYALVDEFVQANDLIETNVVGAMNSNFAFYSGLLAGGAFANDLTEEQILTDVWSQEDEIRQNTTEWVFSFLLMAYQPLSDNDLETYIAFSRTEAGADLNGAIFAAFDGMFEGVSRALGVAAARQMVTQEL